MEIGLCRFLSFCFWPKNPLSAFVVLTYLFGLTRKTCLNGPRWPLSFLVNFICQPIMILLTYLFWPNSQKHVSIGQWGLCRFRSISSVNLILFSWPIFFGLTCKNLSQLAYVTNTNFASFVSFHLAKFKKNST